MKNTKGAVTGSSVEAVAVGEQILRAGGNAVDAAVAAALASCVADPCNTGIGGFGGHMIVVSARQAPMCVDFNLWAPVAVPYRCAGTLGPTASVIPNVVAGLSTALGAFGSMNWAAVIEPAIVLAEHGFICSTTLKRALEDVGGAAFLDECFSFEDAKTGNGLRVRQPALARTLQHMATNGPQWFYEGPIAVSGSRSLKDSGHEITSADWADALEAVTIAPAPLLRLGQSNLFSSPLGTSGSICMFATAAAGRAIASDSDLESPAGICRWAERMAAAWSYRFHSPDGNDIASDGIEDWIGRAATFKPSVMTGTGAGHTCHLNTADKDGMLVATTLTHGKLWFGARWALPGTGIIMNYGAPAMCDPEPKTIARRVYGVTNMCPTVVKLDGGGVVALGSPGARRIASIIGVVLARHIFGQVSLQEAIQRGRFHAQDRGRATLEFDRLPQAVAHALRAAFQIVEAERPADYYGPCTAIRRDSDGTLTLGVDDRWPGFGAIVSNSNE
jgi:gamma-glutamyltranspeptidase / glutathione hydrolase